MTKITVPLKSFEGPEIQQRRAKSQSILAMGRALKMTPT